MADQNYSCLKMHTHHVARLTGENSAPAHLISLKEFHSAGRGFWAGVPDSDWHDWRWQMQHRITSPYSYHTALQVHDGYTVTMTTVFHSEQGVNLLVKFAEEMEKEELLRKQEARLRAQNPTLQKAYEEYQILLKLIK